MLFFFKKLFLLLLFLLCGCSSSFYLIKDQNLVKLKRTALISFYLNRNIYEVDSPPVEVGGVELLENQLLVEVDKQSLRGDYLVQTKQMLVDQLVVDFLKSVKKNGMGGLPRMIPSASIESFQQSIREDNFLKSFEFDDQQEVKDKVYLGSRGMKIITFKEIIREVESGEDLMLGDLVSVEDLGRFANKLGLDGVWIVEVDLAYKLHRKIDRSRSKVRVSTDIKMMLISRSGRVLLETRDIIQGGRGRFHGGLIEVQHVDDAEFELRENSPVYQSYLRTLRDNLNAYLGINS